MQVIIQSAPLEKIQQEGNTHRGKRYQTTEITLNVKQRELFKTALYGTAWMEPVDVEKISDFQKHLIEIKRKRVQRMINRWKQRRIQENFDFSFLTKLFPKSRIAAQIAEASVSKEFTRYVSDKDICMFTFKQLGITTEMLIGKLIEWKFLPSNFYQIS